MCAQKRKKKFGKTGKVILSILTSILMFSALANSRDAVGEMLPEKGPRTEDLIIHYYGNLESAYVALKAGETDIVGYELTKEFYEDAVADPNIALAPVADHGMYEFDINNNCTLSNNPGLAGIPSPTHYRDFRQAIAFLTDKDFIVSEICGGFATRIDQPIAAPYYGWANESMSYPNYPYEYDPDTAAALLDANFTQGSTFNPDYDPTLTWSAEFIRTYPSWHPKAGQDLDPLEVVIRTDDIRRYEAGLLIIGNLRTIGIPVNPTEGDILSIYDKVFGNWDYHLYTGGWSVGRFPPLTLFGLFHSDNAVYGPNYVTGFNEIGDPNYRHLDWLLEQAKNAPSHDESVYYTKLALGYITELAITTPLWTSLDYWAYSKNLLGVVNMEGSGPENDYTFMNAYKTDGTPIRFGLIDAPHRMNNIYSAAFYDMQNLDRMNLYCKIRAPPYDLSIDQAGFVRDWETGTWDGGTKTKVTMWFREDSWFVEPVTGNKKANVNASHYFFTAWMIMQLGDTWWDDNFIDVHHIDIVGPHQVDIYFEFLSYWNTYYASCYILPMDTWAQHDELVVKKSETFVEGVNLTAPGIVNLSGNPVWIKSITENGSPLTMFTDYNIINGKLKIFTTITSGSTVVVDYWMPGTPKGYTPGDLPWQTVFEGAGMYYATDFVPGVGGFLSLKRNPHHWMETPTLGEIDFVWKWKNEPKPRNGSYEIDIFDITRIARAYGSQGTSVPDKNWFPGADTTPLGGQIDIFDIVTVASKYGREWGHTP